jgi:hypothetical protein
VRIMNMVSPPPEALTGTTHTWARLVGPAPPVPRVAPRHDRPRCPARAKMHSLAGQRRINRRQREPPPIGHGALMEQRDGEEVGSRRRPGGLRSR